MFLPLIQNRRSIRKYQKKAVEAETIDQLVEALLRAPTSMGKNSWDFVVVTDPSLLEQLSRAKPHGATFLKNAPLGIVVCGDPQISDVWIENSAIASIYIHLAAASLNLGSCWIQIRERPHDDTRSAEAYVADVLDLPAHLRVLSIIAIGYPDESKAPHPKDALTYDRVSLNSHGTPYPRRP
ncbi:MAG: nitroreductase family protein [Desulfobacterales bacterium]